ncbi:Rab family, other [Strigomonas culicis]|uniref:Rab family, other n=1 Tax=Strigomonas culicis TaxID=28005 RepID=S9US85_9TRYP|nr:Rab family, other [Strigomonas culicis]EPY31975.1 Rab family, other [Strigomonas culicis]|eukprot:EPY31778.1 Rab family, other [Strigomonas culicis]
MFASTAPQADATVKVVTVGDSGVGKSAMLIAFTSGAFNPNTTPTVGSEFFVKRVQVVDKDTLAPRAVHLQLWDTAGQERFRCISRSYYRNMHAAVLVYDVNVPETFEHIERWLGEINSSLAKEPAAGAAEEERVYLLVGNKTDLCANEERMAVDRARAQRFAQEHGMLFALTSAKTQRGVVEAFDELARSVYDVNRDSDSFLNRQRKSGGASLGENGSGGGGGGGRCC